MSVASLQAPGSCCCVTAADGPEQNSEGENGGKQTVKSAHRRQHLLLHDHSLLPCSTTRSRLDRIEKSSLQTSRHPGVGGG
mmetsp:Transcript_40649/g.128173  ORF Transcript_40649/g.128173 Transcript_40649/m.128173 type:complete len:81 (+) Transcript_40649:1076-1318(+)